MDSHTHFMEQAFNNPYPSIECKCTTAKEIEQIIKSLKTKNSYGYDEISTKILKISCPFVSSPANYIPYFLAHIISYHLFLWIHTGLQIHMDMENGHINTKCTKQLQYMVHKLFDIIK